jgi:hypothetical protein
MQTFLKDPSDKLDYVVDFSNLLTPTDIILLVQITTSGSASVSSYTVDGKKVVVFVEGGTVGQSSTISVKVTTNEGRVVERSFRVLTVEM